MKESTEGTELGRNDGWKEGRKLLNEMNEGKKVRKNKREETNEQKERKRKSARKEISEGRKKAWKQGKDRFRVNLRCNVGE